MKTWILASLLFATSVVQAENLMDNKVVGVPCKFEDWQLVKTAIDSNVAEQSNPRQTIAHVKGILMAEMSTRCNLVRDTEPMASIPEEKTEMFLVASSTRSYLIEITLTKWTPSHITGVGITRVK